MSKSQIGSTALLITAIAGALALMLLAAGFAELTSIGGLILLLVLLAYDRDTYRSVFQSLAFSAVCGFCFAIACAVILQKMATHGEVHLANGRWSSEWLPLICGFATVIFWAIDRARMSGRESSELRAPSRRAALPPSFIPTAVSSPSTAGAAPAPMPNAPPASAPPASAPPMPSAAPGYSAAAAPAMGPVSSANPVPSATMYGSPAAAPPPTAAPSPVPPVGARSQFGWLEQAPQESAHAKAPPVEPQRVNPVPVPQGKPALIYVTLVGEGLNVLRSVNAEHLGRDYYRIVDVMPEGETWQFQPGQVVRCKKQNLSSGKALVAIEEAPRAT